MKSYFKPHIMLCLLLFKIFSVPVLNASNLSNEIDYDELFGAQDEGTTKCLNCDEQAACIDRCKTSLFCAECLTRHVKVCLEESKAPKCIGPNCDHILSMTTVKELLKNDDMRDELLKKYVKLAVRNNPNFRICPIDHTTIVRSNNQQWQGIYCQGCKKTHCFECGERHPRGVSCLEAQPEKFKSFIEAFESIKKSDPSLVWKLCPFCGTPTEKIDGCNDIICGNNFHSEHGEMAKDSGCGRKFNWRTAKTFDPNSCVAGPSTSFTLPEDGEDNLEFELENWEQMQHIEETLHDNLRNRLERFRNEFDDHFGDLLYTFCTPICLAISVGLPLYYDWNTNRIKSLCGINSRISYWGSKYGAYGMSMSTVTLNYILLNSWFGNAQTALARTRDEHIAVAITLMLLASPEILTYYFDQVFSPSLCNEDTTGLYEFKEDKFYPLMYKARVFQTTLFAIMLANNCFYRALRR